MNGAWDFLPVAVPVAAGGLHFPPPDTGWQSIVVPSEWNMTIGPFATSWGAYDIWKTPSAWDSVPAAWYRRDLPIPASARGQRVVLHFDAVNFSADVYCNGQLVTQHSDGTLPFEADVTETVHFGGSNEVLVGVACPSAAVTPQGLLFPCGSWWGQACAGIWQDVCLRILSAVHVRESVIRPSVRKGLLEGYTVVRNAGGSSRTVCLRHSVWDGSRLVQRAVPQRLTVAAGAEVTVPLHFAWPDARLWSPQDPHLYTLQAEVADDTGFRSVLDSLATRFGFREVWVEGPRLFLNGTEIRLRGDEWHYFGSLENSRAYAEQWYRMAMAANCTYIRLHAMPYPPVFYDVADEVGMLLVAESAIYGSSNNLALGDARFWQNAATHLEGRVRRDRNHPSVILWSAENEVLAAAGQQWASQVATLKRPIEQEDPTRPIYFEGDGDPEGVGDLVSWHYPLEAPSNPLLPEAAYAFEPGGAQAGNWSRNKPLMISEFGAMYYGTPELLCFLGGSATFEGMDGFWAANALATRAQIEGFRAAGVNGIAPWNTVWYGLQPLAFRGVHLPQPAAEPGAWPLRVGALAATLNPQWVSSLPAFTPNPIHDQVARCFHPNAALCRQWSADFWSEGVVERSLTVYNDTPQTAPLTVTWTLAPQGGPVRTGSQVLQLPPASQAEVQAALSPAAVTQVTDATWSVTVARNGNSVFSDQTTIRLYPPGLRTAPLDLSGAVLLFDPSGVTAQLLRGLGIAVQQQSDLLSLPPTGGGLLMIGEGAAQTAQASERQQVLAFVAAGGRVVVLSQSELPDIFPWHLFLTSAGATVTHLRAPHHPIFAGVDAGALAWWHGAQGEVAPSLVVKPAIGSFRTLADGGPELAGAALGEMAWGEGGYIICQYPLVTLFAQNPVAAVLLRNILTYSGNAAPTRAHRLGVWANVAGPLLPTLAGASVAAQSLPALTPTTLAGCDVLLVDASENSPYQLQAVSASAAALTDWVRGGGTLWVNGMTTATAPSLASVLPTGLGLLPVPVAQQQGALNEGVSALTDGISNADLDWSTTSGGSALAEYAVPPLPGATTLLSVRAAQWSRYSTFPEQTKTAEVLHSSAESSPGAVLARWPVGRGWILIDELRWTASSRKAALLGAALSAALGVGFTAVGSPIPSAGWSAFTNPPGTDPTAAFDGNPGTRWTSGVPQSPGMYFGLDLGHPYRISQVIWEVAQSPTDYPRGVQVEVSMDQRNWTTVLLIADTRNEQIGGILTLDFSPVTAQYVKMIDTGSSPGYWLSVDEIYLFG